MLSEKEIPTKAQRIYTTIKGDISEENTDRLTTMFTGLAQRDLSAVSKAVFTIESEDAPYHTLLDQASTALLPELMTLFLTHGANPNHQSTKEAGLGYTPAHKVIMAKGSIAQKLNCLKILVEHGANLSITDKHNNTALETALDNDPGDGSYLPIVQAITANLATRRYKDISSETALLVKDQLIAMTVDQVSPYLDDNTLLNLRLVSKTLKGSKLIDEQSLEPTTAEQPSKSRIEELRQTRKKHNSWTKAIQAFSTQNIAADTHSQKC